MPFIWNKYLGWYKNRDYMQTFTYNFIRRYNFIAVYATIYITFHIINTTRFNVNDHLSEYHWWHVIYNVWTLNNHRKTNKTYNWLMIQICLSVIS